MTRPPQRQADVLGALPHRRPYRRSEKRAGVAAGSPRDSPSRQPPPSQETASRGAEVVGTMVQAAAELAEIGLSVAVRAARQAASRLPRP